MAAMFAEALADARSMPANRLMAASSLPKEFFGNAANMGCNSFTVKRRTSANAGTAGSNTRVCSTCFTATYLWRKVPAKPRDCKLGNDNVTKEGEELPSHE